MPSKLRSTPITALPLSPSLRAALRRWDIKTWGDLHNSRKRVIRQQGSRGRLLLSELERLLEQAKKRAPKGPPPRAGGPGRSRKQGRRRTRSKAEPTPPKAPPRSRRPAAADRSAGAAQPRGDGLSWSISRSRLESLKSIPITSVSWSTRVLHILERLECKSLADVVALPQSRLDGCPNAGPGALRELEQQTYAFLARPPGPSAQAPGRSRRLPLAVAAALATWSLPPSSLAVLQRTRVSALSWGTRAGNILRYAGCQTLADIARQPRSVWAKYRNVGRLTLTEMEQNLHSVVNRARGAGARPPRPAPPAGHPAPLPVNPVSRVRLFWPEIQQALARTEHADKLLPRLALTRGIPFRRMTKRPLKLSAVLTYDTPEAILKATRSIGKRRLGEIAEVLWRLWAEVVPDGPAGPPPPAAETLAPTLLARLGEAAPPAAAIEAAMEHAHLPEKERYMLRIRYGLSGRSAMTLEQAGTREGLTRERIRQHEKKGLTRLLGDTVSREMLKLTLERRTQDILAWLQKVSGGELILDDPLILSWRAIPAAGGFLVKALHGSTANFLEHLAATGRLRRTRAGWWTGASLPRGSAAIADRVRAWLHGLRRPLPVRCLVTEFGLEPQRLLPVLLAHGLVVKSGFVLAKPVAPAQGRSL